MKLGLQIPSFTWPGGEAEIGPRLAEIARAADEAGFASIWLMDHFYQIQNVGAIDEPMLESYTALAFMAAHTRRATLGTLVTGVVYRHPGVLIKEVNTLDVLSGGRAWLGIGAAWNEREAKGLGIPFPPIKERFERLEESLQIALRMWSEDPQPYHGKHYQLEEIVVSPRPLSRPHPPILIGGTGEQKTLRLVAKYADASNFFAGAGEDVLRHKLDVLRGYCEEEGRPYEAIEKTALSHVPENFNPQDTIAEARSLSALGFSHLIVNVANVETLKPIEMLGEKVILQIAGL